VQDEVRVITGEGDDVGVDASGTTMTTTTTTTTTTTSTLSLNRYHGNLLKMEQLLLHHGAPPAAASDPCSGAGAASSLAALESLRHRGGSRVETCGCIADAFGRIRSCLAAPAGGTDLFNADAAMSPASLDPSV
jgi:hypothetical protein